MVIEAGLDFGALALILIAVGITVTVAYLAELALATPVGSIPVIGDAWRWLWSHVVTYALDAEHALLDAAGNVWSAFIHNLEETAQLVFALSVLLGDAIYKALVVLWHHSLPAYLLSQIKPLIHRIEQAYAAAGNAEHDAQAALAQVEHIVETTIPHAISAAEKDAASLAHTAYSDAVSYADTAVSKLRAAEDAAVAQAVQLAATAEHDALQAYKDATAYVDSLVKPLAGDLSQFEQYVKSLGLPGALAGLAALSTVVTQVLADTGLENEACRSKVKGICGTDPNVWSNLLGLLAAIGFGFSLEELAKSARPLIGAMETVVREAA